MSRDETIMSAVMGAALVMWMFGEQLGISPVLAAMMGLCGLLCTGVLTWRECLSYTPAWDTLCWFAVLIGMSGQLNSMGVINAFAGAMGNVLTSACVSGVARRGRLRDGRWFDGGGGSLGDGEVSVDDQRWGDGDERGGVTVVRWRRVAGGGIEGCGRMGARRFGRRGVGGKPQTAARGRKSRG